jgi:hypothetical protein
MGTAVADDLAVAGADRELLDHPVDLDHPDELTR